MRKVLIPALALALVLCSCVSVAPVKHSEESTSSVPAPGTTSPPKAETEPREEVDDRRASSGTGGTEPSAGLSARALLGVGDVGEMEAALASIGDESLRAAVSDWCESVTAGTDADEYHLSLRVLGDTVTAALDGHKRTDNGILHSVSASAVFDAKKRARLLLSDLFYDGVNYIEYINDTIFAGGIFLPGLEPDAYQQYEDFFIRPFTGVLAGHENIGLSGGERDGIYMTAELTINFPAGNPIFRSPYSLSVPLPVDLSPYGRAVGAETAAVSSGGYTVEYPVIKTRSVESEADAAMNRAIREEAERALARGPGAVVFSDNEMPPGEDLTLSYDIYIWGGKLSVIFSGVTGGGSSYWTDTAGRCDLAVFTGEELDISDYFPENWWESEILYIADATRRYAEVPLPYTPPEGTAVSEIRFLEFAIDFRAVTPGGTVLSVLIERNDTD